MMEIPNRDIITWTIPALIVSIATIVMIAIRGARLAERVKSYEKDLYRQDIESRINELQKQLVVSLERFENTNHLLIEGQEVTNKKGAIYRGKSQDFFRNLGVDINAPVDDRMVFVLMPFNRDFTYKYNIIKQTINEMGLRCQRGDDDIKSTSILPYIVQEMIKSKLVIADITGRNPNVFYELGIAHSLNKPVLIISETDGDIPFDVSSFRILIFNNVIVLKDKLKNWVFQAMVEDRSSL